MADDTAWLAKRAAQGDRAALEVLYRRHVERVVRYARIRTANHEAAADVVEETFLRVARSIRGFKGHSSFTNGLYAVARSVAIEFARRDSRDCERTHRASVLRLITVDGVRRAGYCPPRAPVERATTDQIRLCV